MKSILRNPHKDKFTIISNNVLQDTRLTWKARGLLAYLFSLPDDWEINKEHLIKQSPEGREAFQSGWNELINFGYIHKEYEREKGKIIKTIWILNETPEICPYTQVSTERRVYRRTVKPSDGKDATTKDSSIQNTKENKGYRLVCDSQEETPKVPASLQPSSEGVLEKEQKFPLKKTQQVLYDEIVLIDPDIDKKDLVITIRQYPEEKIKEAISHVKQEIQKGTIFKKPKIGMIKAVLNGKISPVSQLVVSNKKLALWAKDNYKLNTLEIKDKYAVCIQTGKEFPFNRSSDELKQSLKTWHKSLRRKE